MINLDCGSCDPRDECQECLKLAYKDALAEIRKLREANVVMKEALTSIYLIYGHASDHIETDFAHVYKVAKETLTVYAQIMGDE